MDMKNMLNKFKEKNDSSSIDGANMGTVSGGHMKQHLKSVEKIREVLKQYQEEEKAKGNMVELKMPKEGEPGRERVLELLEKKFK